MATKGALSHIDHDIILGRIAEGEYVPQIAAELGVSKQALSQALRATNGDKYQQAREIAAEMRLDDAVLKIEDAEDMLDLARAQHRFRAVAWRAEREFPHRWAQRTQITHDIGPDLGEILRQANKRVAQRTHAAVLTPPEVEEAQIVDSQPVDSNVLVQRDDI